jgi:uridine kinase
VTTARVIVLAGPSGAGKSRLAARTALPVLHLDHFYKDGSDPSLPRITEGPNAGLPDWDDPASWLQEEALAAIEQLCLAGRVDVPDYDIAHDGRCGSSPLDLAGATLFVAEGIFAQEVVRSCEGRGLLAAAYCLRQHPLLTFWRRLTRDLRERRKPPLVLVRRGVALLRAHRRIVADAVRKGCRTVSADQACAEILRLAAAELRQ